MARSRMALVIGVVCLGLAGVLVAAALLRSPSGTDTQVASTVAPPPTSTGIGPGVTAGSTPSGGPSMSTAGGPSVPPSTAASSSSSGTPATAGPGSNGTDTAVATSPVLSIPTAPVGELADRLANAAAGTGFPILGLKSSEWKLSAVDTQTQGGEDFVAVAYEKGTDYVTISQERLATKPSLPEAKPVTIRGIRGEIIEMTPVVLLRWEEGGVSILFSTNLARDAALALADQLQPVP